MAEDSITINKVNFFPFLHHEKVTFYDDFFTVASYGLFSIFSTGSDIPYGAVESVTVNRGPVFSGVTLKTHEKTHIFSPLHHQDADDLEAYLKTRLIEQRKEMTMIEEN